MIQQESLLYRPDGHTKATIKQRLIPELQWQLQPALFHGISMTTTLRGLWTCGLRRRHIILTITTSGPRQMLECILTEKWQRESRLTSRVTFPSWMEILMKLRWGNLSVLRKVFETFNDFRLTRYWTSTATHNVELSSRKQTRWLCTEKKLIKGSFRGTRQSTCRKSRNWNTFVVVLWCQWVLLLLLVCEALKIFANLVFFLF